MAEKATYFTPQFYEFFKELGKNNNKEWFTENKPRFESVVQEPAVRFVRDAGARLQKISPQLVANARPFGGSISRIYRDIRFSPDKSPYKTHIAMHFSHAKAGGPEHMAPGYYLHLESGESGVHSGVWRPEPPTAKKIRDRILDAPDEWRKVLRSKVRLEGESLKRPPPGYDPNHPLIQDLRRKDFVASHRFRDNEVTSPKFLETFVEACESMDPLNHFLADALGLPW
jgi:uncharacterized protein (TIGR02453 family)